MEKNEDDGVVNQGVSAETGNTWFGGRSAVEQDFPASVRHENLCVSSARSPPPPLRVQ